MLRIIWIICYLFLLQESIAQFTVSGWVKNARTDEPLSGATLQTDKKGFFAVTDDQGAFVIQHLPAGNYTFEIRFLGFKTHTISLELTKNEFLKISLEETPQWAEEIVVQATRTSDKNPVPFTNLVGEAIQKRNNGQDLPFILRATPSLVTTSNAGTGIGYTGLRIRGSDATRINVTINGIPFNDSESHGVFWVNMPDIATSTQSIQIQRGVGTSTNGAGAFGASINLNTNRWNETPYMNLINTYGSFHTHRHTLSFGTGRISQFLTFDGRLALIQSDGFIDRAYSNLRSFYFSGAYEDKKTNVRAIAFGGNEVTYQSWYGVPESRLRNDIQGMNDTAAAEEWVGEQKDNLLQSNSRTFNAYTYKNQIDHYTQDHYQLHISRRLGNAVIGQIAFHYTYGRGYYEEFKDDQQWLHYGLKKVVVSGDTIQRTDVIRRRWLDNHFYGITYSVNYENQKYSTIVGGAWNRYQGDHFGEIIWSKIALTVPKDFRYYFNSGDKYDFNFFWKNNYHITKKINAFMDLQYRKITYEAGGMESTQSGLKNIEIYERYHFFNPKVGLTYMASPSSQLYASYGVAYREPTRDDFIRAPENEYPKPEVLYDLEVGFRHKKKKYSIDFNYYLMRYENQLVLTGELNGDGAAIRTNVDRSYRMGLEIEGMVQCGKALTWSANAGLSKNKIENFTEIMYDYGEGFDRYDKIQTHFNDVDISFSPSLVLGSNLVYRPFDGLELTLLSKYISDQFLDNTSNANRKIPSYHTHDLTLAYVFHPRFMKAITLSIFVQNLFNEEYESNGFTYGYKGGGSAVRQNYYYPQAGRNYIAMLALRF